MKTFPELVAAELARVRAAFPPLANGYEAWAMIREELDEFWEEVKKRREDRDPDRLLAELVQVAAMAQAAAEETNILLGDPFPAWVARNLAICRQHEYRIASLHEGYARLHGQMANVLGDQAENNGANGAGLLAGLATFARMIAEDCGLAEPVPALDACRGK